MTGQDFSSTPVSHVLHLTMWQLQDGQLAMYGMLDVGAALVSGQQHFICACDSSQTAGPCRLPHWLVRRLPGILQQTALWLRFFNGPA